MKLFKLFGCILLVFFYAHTVHAQLSGSNTIGEFGMKSGSQPPVGFYFAYMLYDYNANNIVTANGNEISLNGQLDIHANVFGFAMVTKHKVLGATYGFQAFFPIVNIAIEAPNPDLGGSSGHGIGDVWIQPLNLGWHNKQADFLAEYSIYVPSGEYTESSSSNRGLGMWSHEFGAGTTVFFDQKKSIHASGLGTLELHSHKKDVDTKVGSMFTLEGGVGVTTLKGGLDLGMTYYGQCKLSDDSGLDLPQLVQNRLGRNHNLGFGPEATFVLPLSKDLTRLLILNVKYYIEAGTRLDTKGDLLTFTATFKIK